MPGPTLVERRAKAREARQALEAAAQKRRRAGTQLKKAEEVAADANKASAGANELLEESKSRLKELEDHAQAARANAVAVYNRSVELRSLYDDAKSSKKGERPSQGDLDELKQAAEEAKAAAERAEFEAEAEEDAKRDADEKLKWDLSEYRKRAHIAVSANRNVDDFKAAFVAADSEFVNKTTDFEKSKADVSATLVTTEKLEGEWARVSQLRRSRVTATYLRIRTPSKKIDEDAAKAINHISGGAFAQAEMERELRTLITKYGIATEVAAVTKSNRRRRSEVQTRVLAATYFESLLHMMYDHSDTPGAEPCRKEKEAVEQEISDTDGFVEAILIYQMESDDSPLKRFASELVKIVSDRKGIQIETDFKRNLLADQLRARL